MIKRVVTIPRGVESIGNVINDFISNYLRENEYIIDIKYIENGTRLKHYEEGRGGGFETVVVAIVHIGELNNESS
jgi:hypothetical protein|nr:MAG TPA: hypothetical protein [Caudoviricetes sp.]